MDWFRSVDWWTIAKESMKDHLAGWGGGCTQAYDSKVQFKAESALPLQSFKRSASQKTWQATVILLSTLMFYTCRTPTEYFIVTNRGYPDSCEKGRKIFVTAHSFWETNKTGRLLVFLKPDSSSHLKQQRARGTNRNKTSSRSPTLLCWSVKDWKELQSFCTHPHPTQQEFEKSGHKNKFWLAD